MLIYLLTDRLYFAYKCQAYRCFSLFFYYIFKKQLLKEREQNEGFKTPSWHTTVSQTVSFLSTLLV